MSVTAPPIPLYPYQREARKMVIRRKGKAGLFMEMGTGKSPTALDTIRGAKRVLVVAPLSVISVWEAEIKKFEQPYRFLDLSVGSIAARAKLLNRARAITEPLLVAVNYEAFWRKPLRQAIARFKWQAVIMDEAHRIKNRTTKQSKFAHELARKPYITCRLALTGTPVTNGIEDLFSLYAFIDPTVFGTNWYDFESKYLILGGYMKHQIVGYRNQAEVNHKVNTTSYQIKKSEALSLPPRTDTVVPVALSAKTWAKYEEFRENAVAQIEGFDEHGQAIEGVALGRIMLTVLLRLQQITGGFVKTEGGATVDLSTEKLDVAAELAETAFLGGEKVVIYCNFVHDIERLKARFPQARVLAGSVSAARRVEALTALRDGSTNLLLVQIKAGALGIDLTAASVAIFYSTGYSLSDFLQSRDRQHRHGQKRKVSCYYLVGKGTVDEKIYKALSDKQSLARMVTHLDYAQDLLG